MCGDEKIFGVLGFYTLLLIGISLVSLHYRQKYEDLREWIKLKKEIGEL